MPGKSDGFWLLKSQGVSPNLPDPVFSNLLQGQSGFTVDYVVVAGGGGGADSSASAGGGGGGGGGGSLCDKPLVWACGQ